MFLEAIDQGALHGLHNILVQPFPWMKDVMRGFALATGHWGLALLALGCAFTLLRLGLRRQAILVLVAEISSVALGLLTLLLVPRETPNVSWAPIPPPYPHSFPSLPTLTFTAVWGTFTLLLLRAPCCNLVVRLLGTGLSFVLPLLVSMGCLLTGHSYVSDVLGGLLGGLALMLTLAWVEERQPAASPLPQVRAES